VFNNVFAAHYAISAPKGQQKMRAAFAKGATLRPHQAGLYGKISERPSPRLLVFAQFFRRWEPHNALRRNNLFVDLIFI